MLKINNIIISKDNQDNSKELEKLNNLKSHLENLELYLLEIEKTVQQIDESYDESHIGDLRKKLLRLEQSITNVNNSLFSDKNKSIS